MGKLSVIIPLYKGHDTLKQALHSIAMQSIINDIEIVIINDKDGIGYSDILNKFSDLNIKYVTNPQNLGCAGARNTGIKNATSEYILFLDSDDALASPLSAELLYHRAITTNADIVVGEFQSEMRCDKGVAIKEMKHSATWMHSKLFKKSFLIDNDLWFVESLRINEDAELFQLAVDLGANIVELNYNCSLWRDNPNSITHESLYNNKRSFIDACAEYIKECNKRCLMNERIVKRVLENLTMIYYYANIVIDECGDKVEDYMAGSRKYWELAEPIVKDVDDDLITKVYCNIAKTFEIIPTISFIDFLNKLRS